MRVHGFRATLSLALAVAAASADPSERGLRAAGDTTNLDFGDLHGDVAAGLSFATLSGGSSSDAPGAVREVAVANGSRGPQDAAAGALAYTHPNGTSFYDLVGDLSSKWASFGDAVPVPSGAQTSLATICDATKDLDACVRACATACFGNNACQWFTLAPATRDCFLFRSVKPVAGVTFAAVAPDAQRICGYIKAAPPALLSAKAACTETRVYNGKDTLCVTADSAFYLESSTGKTQCAASPLTLVRSFQNNYFNKGTETALTEQLKTGQLLNAKQMAPPAAGGEFTLENFLQYIGPAKAPLVVTTSDVAEDPLTQQLTAAGTTTKWTYSFDAHGRVASVSAPLSKKNLLYAKDTTTGKMTQRKDYGKPALQTRFSYSVHALSAVKVAQPNLGAANGGEIADSLFTSPNGFWNLVPQSDASRVTGCWKQSNDLIAKLLEWGFTVDFTAQPQYFTSADAVQTEALKAVASSHQLFTGADVKQFYESTGAGVGDLNFQADFPCAYLYRPYAMKASVKLTACKEGSYCSGAWPAIQKATDKTFFTVSSIGAVETSRSFAHWAFENKDGGVKGSKPSFTYLKALATSTAGVCFTETGKSLPTLSLSSKVSDVLLVTKDGKCVALSATDGSPTIVDCDASATRVSFDGSATTASCLVGLGATCPTFAFTTALSETIAIKQRDDLVAGTLSFGDKGCLVVDVSKITFSTDKAACSPIKASYVTLAATGGDPVDPDEATEAPVVSQNTVVVPPAKREIDDPDMEAN